MTEVQIQASDSFCWSRKISCRTIDGTAFVLLQGRMLSLNLVGTRMFELFKTGATIADVVSTIVGEFDTTREQAEADVIAFVAKLVAREMLVEGNNSTARGEEPESSAV